MNGWPNPNDLGTSEPALAILPSATTITAGGSDPMAATAATYSPPSGLPHRPTRHPITAYARAIPTPLNGANLLWPGSGTLIWINWHLIFRKNNSGATNRYTSDRASAPAGHLPLLLPTTP
jgi:hypothetical protein